MNGTGAAGNRSCGGGGGGGEEPVPLPTFSTAAKVRVALTCVLFLSSACCNGAVLWAAARAPRRRPPRVRLLMANLAAADLLVTVVVMPLDAAWNATVQWYGGDAACRALMFLKLAAMYASAFVTVVIALDRHAAIVTPLAVGRAERRNKAMLSAAWTLSALLALPQAFVFHTVSRSRPRRFVQCATLGSFGAHWQETLYNMFTFACLFLLPLLVMVLCYGRILAAISGRMKEAHASSSREFQLRRSYNNIPRARMRTLRMSIAIVLTFIVCWTPYYLLGLWYWFSPEMLTRQKVPPALSHILFLFGLFNACLDPVVYGLFTVHFRREMWRACRCSRRRQEQDAAALTGSFRASTAAGRAGSSLGGAQRQPGGAQQQLGGR
ncbi:gonadotropin-releasing hormone II receptor-like isoform X1 [Oxyura jamaicensis]|uniref:gonadotropin-releasing hormone II receptor-like isoform X1 n=1 Tax=Oxyura jamaicensis TaxID=8884 RepID=UPI0015A5408D|nr:gonadotropin-releasing hormone II receptor-like isoform X1 [Oxyura jamaicensis]